jgi:hypothetical protein
MLNRRALVLATFVGTVLQLAMVLLGHVRPGVASLFAVGGMGLSLVAGLLYAWLGGAGSRPVVGGLIAGGACALLGILVSWGLGDVAASVLGFGTASSAVTGALGGWLGGLAARNRGGTAAP